MRADRLLSIMLLLNANGRMTAADLSDQLEVSERTIYRDLDALTTAGIPVFAQSGTNGGIYLDEDYRVSLTALSHQELQALFVSAGSGALDAIGLRQSGALLKLFASLPSRQQSEVERLRQRLHMDPANWFQVVDPPRFLPLLQQAVWEDRRIQAHYQPVESADGDRVLDAYALVAKANIWYLVAKKPEAETSKMRNFRVARVETLELLDERFERDAAFDLATYWRETCEKFERESSVSNPLYHTRLRVHPEMFWYFPGYMEGSYEKVGQPDAEGWFTVSARFANTYDARTRVMGLGAMVEVIEPDELRDGVIKTAQAILDYANKTAGK